MWSIKSQIQSMPGDISKEGRFMPPIFQAVHWAATDSAGALQAGFQGNLPWAEHGGGARTWWALSFCGSCFYEGSQIIRLLFFSVYFSIIKSIVMKMIWNKFLRRIIDLLLEEKIKTTNENVIITTYIIYYKLQTTRFPRLGGKLVKYEAFLRECLSCNASHEVWLLLSSFLISH